MSKLTIGLPVYNGEKFVGEALQSLIWQTYSNWEILISDNASTDGTQQVCEEFVKADPRIRYVRQAENIGIVQNYLYLLNTAESDFFMWASADDKWDATFVEKCISALLSNADIGLSSSNFKNINSSSEVVREYPSSLRFIIPDKKTQLVSFFLDPEVLGKSNLIYGIYRIAACKELINRFFTERVITWGGDNAFVFGILLQTDIHVEEECLFFKRTPDNDGKHQAANLLKPAYPYLFGGPMDKVIYDDYFEMYSYLSKGTPYEEMIEVLIAHRINTIKDFFEYKNAAELELFVEKNRRISLSDTSFYKKIFGKRNT